MENIDRIVDITLELKSYSVSPIVFNERRKIAQFTWRDVECCISWDTNISSYFNRLWQLYITE
jgi:hypothetical protein